MGGHVRVICTATLAGLLSGLALVLATGVASSAQPGARASASPDAGRVLAPIPAFNRAAVRRRSQLRPLAEAWQTTLVPCAQAAYEDIKARRQNGQLTANQRQFAEALTFLVSVYDAAQDVAKPLDGALAAAERSYRRMPVRDRVLRAGARAKAKQLNAWRKLGDIDACRFAEEWAERNYAIRNIPAMAPEARTPIEIGGVSASRAVARGAKRLRKLGVRKSRAESFEAFPLEQLVNEAARMLPEEIIPPSLQ
jgi:hypothetical protein